MQGCQGPGKLRSEADIQIRFDIADFFHIICGSAFLFNVGFTQDSLIIYIGGKQKKQSIVKIYT